MKTITDNMKKALFIFIITAISSAAWSQSLSTVSGKTLDGKTIKVTYYHGTSEDYIQSVKYQLVDELQAKVNKLQGESRDLQNRLDAANKRIKEVEETAVNSRSEQSSQFENQIAKNQEQVSQLNQEISSLRSQLDSIASKSAAEKHSLQLTIDEKNQYIAEIQQQQKQQEEQAKKPISSPAIGIMASLGQVSPINCVNEYWQKENELSMKYYLFYRTSSLAGSFPLSIEAGLGYHSFSLKAKRAAHSLANATSDCDGIAYNAIYNYSDLQECLKLNSLIVPISIYIGRTIKSQTTVYAKLGLTPSVVLSSNYQASGTYSVKGYYPQWGALLENISELGFIDGKQYEYLDQPNINKFVLWGNVSLGVNIRLGRAPIQINAGIDVDYSITSLGKAVECDEMPNGRGLLPKEGNVLIPGVNVGLIYLLK